MNRLSKYTEAMPYGRLTDRVAYVMSAAALPEPAIGSSWQRVATFNAGNEILRDPGLKDVFKVALATGCTTVSRKSG